MVEDEGVRVTAYDDDTYGKITGTCASGDLTSYNYSFFINKAIHCDDRGRPTGATSSYVTVSGKTTLNNGGLFGLFLKSITLTPDEQTVESYIHRL